MVNESTEKKRKGWYLQSFKDDWLELEDFKGWLKRDEADKNGSYCTCCRIPLKNASKSMLVAHKNTKKHNSNFVVVKSAMNISQFVSKKRSSDSEKITNAEMLFAGFFSEHLIRFSNVYSQLRIQEIRRDQLNQSLITEFSYNRLPQSSIRYPKDLLRSPL